MEFLECIRAQAFYEWCAQRAPVVLSEVENTIPEGCGFGDVEGSLSLRG